MSNNSNSNNKLNVLITGKYADFKREEYSIMMTRIESINKVMTEKCKLLSLKPLEKNFSFDFVFCGIETYLHKINEYDKKQRKDDLKKWWMNQKASEMAKDCLPSILDRMDQISTTIAKQEKSELSRHKFEKYLKYQLLDTALKSSFRRPRASSANVFPNTSFQYARSRLRKKLENTYFTEADLTDMSSNNKKKKDEWIKLIEIKKLKYQEEYYADKKKKKLKKHKKNKKRRRMSTPSHSTNVTDSICSSTGGSDELIDINDIPPPPPPNNNAIASTSTSIVIPMNMPIISSKKPSGYCSQCTSYAIQLSKLTNELHSFKISLGETQMELNNTMQELNHWKQKYKQSVNTIPIPQTNGIIDYKLEYNKKANQLKQLQSQIALLIGTNTNIAANISNNDNQNNNNNINNNNVITRARHNSQHSMSFQSSECSGNAISDKMSISGNSSLNRYNFMTADSVISGFPAIHNQSHSQSQSQQQHMSQIVASHLKHNSNSTEKMINKLQTHSHSKQNSKSKSKSDSNESFLSEEAENVLSPITNNQNNQNQNNDDHDVDTKQDNTKDNNSESTFASNSVNHRNYNNQHQQQHHNPHYHPINVTVPNIPPNIANPPTFPNPDDILNLQHLQHEQREQQQVYMTDNNLNYQYWDNGTNQKNVPFTLYHPNQNNMVHSINPNNIQFPRSNCQFNQNQRTVQFPIYDNGQTVNI